MREKVSAEERVREIRRKTRKKYSAEEEGAGRVGRAARRRGASPSCAGRKGSRRICHYRWSKEFLEAGKKRLAGDTKRDATSSEVIELRQENEQLKQAVAENASEEPLSLFSGSPTGSRALELVEVPRKVGCRRRGATCVALLTKGRGTRSYTG